MPGSSAAGRTRGRLRSLRRWPISPPERPRPARRGTSAWKCSPCGSSAGTRRWPTACRRPSGARPRRHLAHRRALRRRRDRRQPQSHRPHLLQRLHPVVRPERHVPSGRLHPRRASRRGRDQAARHGRRLHPFPPRRGNAVQPHLRGAPVASGPVIFALPCRACCAGRPGGRGRTRRCGASVEQRLYTAQRQFRVVEDAYRLLVVLKQPACEVCQTDGEAGCAYFCNQQHPSVATEDQLARRASSRRETQRPFFEQSYSLQIRDASGHHGSTQSG